MLFVIFCIDSNSQTSIDCIDLSRIPQRKLRNFLKHERENNIRTLADFRPSCVNDQETSGFCIMQNTYLIKESLDIVWDAYRNTNLAQAWNGKMISFGLLFSKWSDQIQYWNDELFTGIDTGQVFLIDLKIFRGLYNLPVGVQVLKIDSLLRTVTLSYIEGGKSKGFQTIHLFNDENGYTKVVHTSAFKSCSKFRDKHLYPYFHTKVLNEFHWNIMSRHLNNQDEFIISP